MALHHHDVSCLNPHCLSIFQLNPEFVTVDPHYFPSQIQISRHVFHGGFRKWGVPLNHPLFHRFFYYILYINHPCIADPP